MKVPIYEQQVRQQGFAGQQTAQATPSNLLNTDASAFTQLAGDALTDVNAAAHHHYNQQLEEANNTRVQDGLNQFQAHAQDQLYGEHGAFNQRGEAAFKQANGKPVSANTLDALTQKQSEIVASLGNGTQRQQFLEHSNQLITHTRGQLMGYEAGQHRTYQRSTITASQELAANNVKLHYNDPALIQAGIDKLYQSGDDLARLEGLDPAFGKAQAQKQVSDTLSGAIQSALMQGDHAAATALLKQFSPHMDTNHMLKNYELITQADDTARSYSIAQEVMSAVYPKMVTGDKDRMDNITVMAESGGHHFAPGTQTLTTSPKGARGIAQIMPATGKDPGYGITPLQNDSEQEHRRFGSDYLGAMLTVFSGDKAKAWAAYNGGVGATQKALAKADKEGGDWLSYLPQETRAYVAKNLKAYAAGEGQHPRPTLQDAHAQALAQLGDNPRPELRKETLAEVTHQYNEQTQAIKQRGEEATAEAMRQLLATGGKFSSLPAHVQAAVPVKDVDNVKEFAAKNAKGEPIQTDWPLYYQLKTDPALLRQTNLMAVRGQLDEPEFKQLAADQKAVLNGDGSTQVRSASAILNGYMREAGIDPSPKDDDQKGAAEVGRIWSAFEQQLAQAEQDAGRKLDTDGIKKVAARLFTPVNVDGGWLGSDKAKPAILVDAQNDEVVVPDADREQIITALRRARPGIPVTEDDIFYLYMQEKGLF